MDADELWLWHGPGRLELQVDEETLVLDRDRVQGLVPAGRRQRARPLDDVEALVSCVVSPGFRWSGFALS